MVPDGLLIHPESDQTTAGFEAVQLTGGQAQFLEGPCHAPCTKGQSVGTWRVTGHALNRDTHRALRGLVQTPCWGPLFPSF